MKTPVFPHMVALLPSSAVTPLLAQNSVGTPRSFETGLKSDDLAGSSDSRFSSSSIPTGRYEVPAMEKVRAVCRMPNRFSQPRTHSRSISGPPLPKRRIRGGSRCASQSFSLSQDRRERRTFPTLRDRPNSLQNGLGENFRGLSGVGQIGKILRLLSRFHFRSNSASNSMSSRLSKSWNPK